uniref:Alpha-1,3-mannosyl-glycoprotein 2-beta-N-acetylglucosaminyltransferase n=1 Tax=Ciona savignyi TaxID=51511 RepID=H2YNG9_CIOSA
MVELKINNKIVNDDHQSNEGRGIHVFVLNQATGQIINNEIFDTFVQGQDELMIQYLKSIDDEHRLLAFAVKDEASLNLGRKAKIHLETLGSNLIGSLGWRGTWVMLCYNNGRLIDETIRKTPDVNKWAEPSVVESQIQPQQLTDYSTCEWIASKEENDRRRNFCSKYEGYGGLCRCDRPHDLYIQARNIPNNRIHDVPVAVIASNRPQYLYRMLMTLLNADGVNKDKIIVFIDGHFVETMEVARLLGVRGIYHTPAGVKAARISQHYKSSLSAIFELNPDSDYAIIIEEDLDIAPDFFSYFNQLLPVFESDESIYCLSAWNDQATAIQVRILACCTGSNRC